ncbi:PRTRC system protein B [Pseudomonas mosselii]|uniref:PRTRC system protein B n=1 Tax=Pseudomonas mosselii TaxID=78327 RepID=UPI0021D8447E|nr:PRTRC system protein B [Pseudomonas mosselii]MCU9528514.1 PRTRC system protein B [Pseudomonas mosselii]MCU9535848.1 PRTRC system protein B [Pseudomonas mosselii]MCU9542906.1 PRTRC system protein B [Pseudomonas mosselii]MCU9548787.1 PRTRC system protein B [Pseudomonas mosselii]
MLNSQVKARALLAFHHLKTGRLDFTSHEVIEAPAEGVYTLGAGRAFSEEDKEGFIDILLNVEAEIEFIDTRVLVKSRTMLVWYNAPQVIDIHFQGAIHTAPIPGLIYIATPGKLRCFAYKGKARPKPETKLYLAPLGNMYKSGSFCTGNCDVPKEHNIASIPGWERFVLHCTNTHMGTKTLKTPTEYKEVIAFYENLSDTKAKSFPSSELMPAGGKTGQITLRDALALGGEE